MNLSALAGPIVAAVNPWTVAQYRQSTGLSTTLADGTQVPSYAEDVTVSVQMQAMSAEDLRQMSGLNIQGEKQAMYVQGSWRGVSRPDVRGGDLVTLQDDGTAWLVVHVLENWGRTGGWAKVAVTRQMP